MHRMTAVRSQLLPAWLRCYMSSSWRVHSSKTKLGLRCASRAVDRETADLHTMEDTEQSSPRHWVMQNRLDHFVPDRRWHRVQIPGHVLKTSDFCRPSRISCNLMSDLVQDPHSWPACGIRHGAQA